MELLNAIILFPKDRFSLNMVENALMVISLFSISSYVKYFFLLKFKVEFLIR